MACLREALQNIIYLIARPSLEMKANIVLDNLIDKKEMPVVIAVFINPGDKGPGMPVYEGTGTVDIVSNTAHRSFSKPYGGFGTITRTIMYFVRMAWHLK
jgi:hypothetical protein